MRSDASMGTDKERTFPPATSKSLFPQGIFRITAAAPKVAIADPASNAKACIEILKQTDADLVLFPELALSGYTCGDLFANDALLGASQDALSSLAKQTTGSDQIVVVGLPLTVRDSLMNVAAVVADGAIAGVVPKSYLPNYREFYEARHFRAASESDPEQVEVCGEAVPFGTNLLFKFCDAIIGIEICEDVWTPVPPSSMAAVAGANVLLNLSASNETIGKVAWRRDLIKSQSGRCIAGYVYCSSGPTESTSDLVFGGHCLIAENGIILNESRRVGDGAEPAYVQSTSVTCDLDLQRIAHDRRVVGSFDDVRDSIDVDYHIVELFTDVRSPSEREELCRRVDAHPFVPSESKALDERCAEIFGIQTAGLVKRLSRIPESLPLSIGVSGGLDSTLALLVALQACDAMGRDRSCIHGITMPGFGTTSHTKTSADQLIELTGITGECIDIRELCLDTFRAMNHQPLGIEIDDSTTADSLQKALSQVPAEKSDLTFENVQARVRTMLLMSRGFVLGTGDMSEQALGWCTYNADHMSMYNVNTSIPKTLVRFLVRYAADHYFQDATTELLHRIAETTISPELMPPAADGSIQQDTEASIGAYELHDFFLYHFVRNGFKKEKILYLAKHAKFDQEYEQAEIADTLDTFISRFFGNQFKRNCVPDGPKVGSVSLSPRGDWRMPSDGDSNSFR